MSWDRLKLKHGVALAVGHLRPPVYKMLQALLATAPETTDTHVVLTSLNDGRHKRNSKHYDDEAVDIRCWNIEVEDEEEFMHWTDRPISRAIAVGWAKEMQEALGQDYQVLFEEHEVNVAVLGRKILVPHIHAEWDPA